MWKASIYEPDEPVRGAYVGGLGRVGKARHARPRPEVTRIGSEVSRSPTCATCVTADLRMGPWPLDPDVVRRRLWKTAGVARRVSNAVPAKAKPSIRRYLAGTCLHTAYFVACPSMCLVNFTSHRPSSAIIFVKAPTTDPGHHSLAITARKGQWRGVQMVSGDISCL